MKLLQKIKDFDPFYPHEKEEIRLVLFIIVLLVISIAGFWLAYKDLV